jgi:hypothetical protein
VVTTTNSTVIARGSTRLSLAAIRVGQAISVQGAARADGSVLADKIEIEDDGIELRGTIESLTAPNLKVAGHVVVTDAATKFERDEVKITFADLKVGDTVKVEGQLQADNSVLAREIEIGGHEGDGQGEGEEHDADLKGAIESLAAPKLTVAGKTVVTNTETIFERDDMKISFADLKVGDTVEVEGTLQADGSVLARKIEVRVAEGEEENHDVEVEGAIESIALPKVTVAGKVVVTDAGTEIERGDTHITAADLKVGDMVKVEGTLQADGTILAREIKVKT